MKLPKARKKYCKYCKTHTEQKVSLAKNRTRGTAHPLSLGSKTRMHRRSEARGSGNMGKVSRGAMNKWKRFNKKQSKHPDTRFTCQTCKKTATGNSNSQRAKKIEFK